MGETYNGWANYETWLVALWIDNDRGSYEYSREMVAENRGGAHERFDVAHALKDWFEESDPLADEASVWSDLLHAALSEVDWYEIADNYLTEIVEA